MQTKVKYTAVLFNARVDSANNRVEGNIYCDVAGRFRDGEWVTTSDVLELGSNFARTKNSHYKVVWAQ